MDETDSNLTKMKMVQDARYVGGSSTVIRSSLRLVEKNRQIMNRLHTLE